MDTFGEILRELRLEKNLTQNAFGKIFSVEKGTVSNWENENRFPDKNMLNAIADYFNVSLDYLLGRSYIKNPQQYYLNLKNEIAVLTDEEKNILNLYKKLNDKDKAKVEGIMENKIDEYKDSKKIISSTCQNIEDIS